MENEIKVGEYIRTKDGIIDKIVDIRDTYSERKLIALEKSNSLILDIGLKTRVVKHSPNLIDLIEVGDYVNGFLVADKYKNVANGRMIVREDCGDAYYDGYAYNEDIKSIVTYEQFESVSYKVEE